MDLEIQTWTWKSEPDRPKWNRSAKVDLISQTGRDRQNLARSAKVDAIGQVNLIGKQTSSPIGTAAGRGAGAVVIMKRERAHTIGRTWTQMPNLDAKAEPGKSHTLTKFRPEASEAS